MRERGGDAGEYGATTGRPRRVGWFDAVATRYLQGGQRLCQTLPRINVLLEHLYGAPALRLEPLVEELLALGAQVRGMVVPTRPPCCRRRCVTQLTIRFRDVDLERRVRTGRDTSLNKAALALMRIGAA